MGSTTPCGCAFGVPVCESRFHVCLYSPPGVGHCPVGELGIAHLQFIIFTIVIIFAAFIINVLNRHNLDGICR